MAVVEKESLLFPFLQKKWSDVSRERLKRLLHDGRILVNGKSVTRFDFVLKEGDRVDVGPSVVNRAVLKNRFVRLVYEDRYLVVIEKNIGILSMASSHHSFCVKTVLDGYFERSRQRCRAHVVHRLDRDTSGLMIYA
ncbi:MAG: pseudouridine synthase, partial [Bacteroidaceae bacterium]|nr:pseudouridine synthase [Bacteroidaceae bacterium]